MSDNYEICMDYLKDQANKDEAEAAPTEEDSVQPVRITGIASMVREAAIKPYQDEILELRKHRDRLIEANNAELEKRRAAEADLTAMTRRLDRVLKAYGFESWDEQGVDAVLDRADAAKKNQ